MNYETARRLEQESIKNRHETAFEKFGLKCAFDLEEPESLGELMVGYEPYTQQLFKAMINTLVNRRTGKKNVKRMALMS